MPLYVMLTTLTPEGVQTLKNNPARINEVNREVEQLGLLRAAAKRPDERVLAPAGADDEYGRHRAAMNSSIGIAGSDS